MNERQTTRLPVAPVQRILDTVVLVSFVDSRHPLHQAGKKHVESLATEPDVFLPSTAIIELDLVFKGARFKYQQRREIYELLRQVIPDEKVLPLTLSVMKKAIELEKKARWTSHYFDVLIAAYASTYSAKILTTDKMIPTLGVPVEW
ncbi:MAG TPA: PIN domain-containing protein [Nitrososphaerales archaeon]|nr:PIN domain-containing protein [Nitrososphaerales archaeon]